jgi:lysophospholipase L1-like esterase
MIRDAKQRGIRPMLATIPPARPGGRRDGLPALIAAFNDQVRALARREAVDLIDVFAAMDLSMIGQDDLHPTPQGYDVMAQTFYNVIVSALDVPVTLTSRR